VTDCQITRDDITGVMLCGGSARRMGGVEKPLAVWQGTPLVQHVRARLAPQVASIIISANREHDRYATWGDDVIADLLADAGPLAGVQAALHRVTTPLLFCCPGDAPRLDPTLIRRLANALAADANTAIAVPDDGTRQQFLFMLLRANPLVTRSLDTYLAAGARSVHGWLATLPTVAVDARDLAESFANINTTAELDALTDAPLGAHR
jgi:molybdenum cofactor guanylyltransferase